MKRSTNGILTTHAGRLPNPRNIELKNDTHGGDEFWKALDGKYYSSRSTGIDMKPVTTCEPPSIVAFQGRTGIDPNRG